MCRVSYWWSLKKSIKLHVVVDILFIMSTKAWMEANRDKMRAYRMKHYHENKQPYLDRSTVNRKERAAWFKSLKEGRSCLHCGESFWACLDYHHRNPEEKDERIALLLRNGVSRERLLEEIAKCDLVCSNCHRKIHNGGLG